VTINVGEVNLALVQSEGAKHRRRHYQRALTGKGFRFGEVAKWSLRHATGTVTKKAINHSVTTAAIFRGRILMAGTATVVR